MADGSAPRGRPWLPGPVFRALREARTPIERFHVGMRYAATQEPMRSQIEALRTSPCTATDYDAAGQESGLRWDGKGWISDGHSPHRHPPRRHGDIEAMLVDAMRLETKDPPLEPETLVAVARFAMRRLIDTRDMLSDQPDEPPVMNLTLKELVRAPAPEPWERALW